MLYPQNGDRIVAIDSVTSLRPMYYPKDGESRRKSAKDDERRRLLLLCFVQLS